MGDHNLTVMQDFGRWKKGATIDDPDMVASFEPGGANHEQSVHVRRVYAAAKPDAPAAAKVDTVIDTSKVEAPADGLKASSSPEDDAAATKVADSLKATVSTSGQVDKMTGIAASK